MSQPGTGKAPNASPSTPLWVGGSLLLGLLVGGGLFALAHFVLKWESAWQYGMPLLGFVLVTGTGLGAWLWLRARAESDDPDAEQRDLQRRRDAAALEGRAAQMREGLDRALVQLGRMEGGESWKGRGPVPGGPPWVLLVGPTDSGKSTALSVSRLRLEPVATPGGKAGGRAGAKADGRTDAWFQFWRSEQAVFLELPGRLISAEDARDDWRLMLEQLHRHPLARPVSALVLQVGIDSVLEADASARESLALRLRSRLDDVLACLETACPVLLHFSRCDRLDGFVPFFQRMEESTSESAWQFALDVQSLARTPVASAFEEGLEGLRQRLIVHLDARLANVSSGAELEAALSFPAELARHAETLATFTALLFEERRGRERPHLVRVQFSSAKATETGAPPLEGVREQLATSYALSAPSGVSDAGVREAGSSLPSTGIFVRGALLEGVSWATQAAPMTRAARQKHFTRLGMAVLLVSCLLGVLSWLLAGRYGTQRQWLEDVAQAAIGLGPVTSATGGTSVSALKADLPEAEAKMRAERLNAVLTQQLKLGALKGEGGPDAVLSSLDALLTDSTDVELLLPLRPLLNRELSRAAAWNPQADDGDARFVADFQGLKARAILVGQKCPDMDPKKDATWLGGYLAHTWVDALGTSSGLTPAVEKALATRLTEHFTTVSTSRVSLDDATAERARKALSQSPAPSLFVKLAAADADLLGRSTLIDVEQLKAPGLMAAFTGEGCRAFVNSALGGKQWLNCALPELPPVAAADWQAAYQSLYEQAWLEWWGGAVSALPDAGADAGDGQPELLLGRLVRSLDALAAREPSLLSRIFGAMKSGAPCSAPTKASKDADPKAEAPSVNPEADVCAAAAAPVCRFQKLVSDNADPPPVPALSQYLASASALRDLLRGMNDSANRNDQALELVRQTMEGQGALRKLSVSREDLLTTLTDPQGWPGMSPEALTRLNAHAQTLNQRLEGLEQKLLETLFKLAAGGVQAKWEQSFDVWQNKARFKGGDSPVEACQRIKGYVAETLTPFMEADLGFFYTNIHRCELKRYQGFAMPISAVACKQLNQVRDTTLECVAGAAPPEPTLSGRVDISCPSLTDFRLDTGKVVLECDNRRGACTERPSLPSAGNVNLKTTFKSGKSQNVDNLAPSLMGLAKAVKSGQRTGQVNGAVLSVLLAESEMPRGYCARPELSLYFNGDVLPGGGTKGVSAGELNALKLPSSLKEP